MKGSSPWSLVTMKPFEKISTTVRHLPLVERADWLWDSMRPLYERAVRSLGYRGLERILNDSDRVLISPEARGTGERYEPGVWRALMAELRAGDTFVDVGAFIGLYAVAVALRLGREGRVVAFEPNSRNFSLLLKHVRLNGVEEQTELHQAAVSNVAGRFLLLANGSSEARLVSDDQEQTESVQVVTLDGIFAGRRIDILKIDVEGHEEKVLRGAQLLLRQPSCRPRAIFIEVHPYAWRSVGTQSADLLELLRSAGYRVETLEGHTVPSVERYGEIVARV
jgi:FkbM family methyltransferase